MMRLTQGTPLTAASNGDVYDVIKRIKAGNFKGADYVQRNNLPRGTAPVILH